MVFSHVPCRDHYTLTHRVNTGTLVPRYRSQSRSWSRSGRSDSRYGTASTVCDKALGSKLRLIALHDCHQLASLYWTKAKPTSGQAVSTFSSLFPASARAAFPGEVMWSNERSGYAEQTERRRTPRNGRGSGFRLAPMETWAHQHVRGASLGTSSFGTTTCPP